jgi:hypothetical protein
MQRSSPALFGLILTVALFAATPRVFAAEGFALTPPAGPHAVGLKVIAQSDASRASLPEPDIFGHSKYGERARPMQTLLWYPAAAGGHHLHYLDYLKTSATEDDSGMPTAEVDKAVDVKLRANGTAPGRVQQAMLATRDALPAAGKFPVVIYAPSFAASAAENADLCEYLASHGYIVLASASRGSRSRLMTDDLDGLEAQAADILYLTAFAATVPGADMQHVAATGFSWGGLANVFAAAKSVRIKALVSLDGSVRSYPQLIADSKYVTPATVAVPMLSIGSANQSIERLNEREKSTAISFLNSMKFSDVYLATSRWMEHMNFSGEGLRTGADGSFTEYSRDELAAASVWNARYVRAFLDAYLKGDGAAKAFLGKSPGDNGVPKHMMDMKVRLASAQLPSKAVFIDQFNGKGRQGAIALYEAMKKAQPGFTLSPLELNQWGYQLLRASPSQPQAAIEIFKLAIHLEPKWGGVWDSLGEAYEGAGDKALAIDAYGKALALDPSLDSSARRLKVLRAN